MINRKPLIIFDSGIGGFSILKSLLNLQPAKPIIYLADKAGLPYGTKTPVWIRNRLTLVANWAKHQHPSAFILACNTATVSGIFHLRSLLDCPIVGVEPVIKPLSQAKQPLLLATPTTLKLISSDSILGFSPPNLVQAIEAMDMAQIKISLQTLQSIIQQHSIQTLGLSCTHYPLASHFFKQLYPRLKLIDPSQAIVKHLSTLVNLGKLDKTETPQLQFLTTNNPSNFKNQVKYYLNIDNIKVGKLSL